MKRLILIIVPILLNLGCHLTKQSVKVGSYSLKVDSEVSYSLTIQEHNRFEYKWIAGLNNGSINGTWKRRGSYLILNGGTIPPPNNLTVIEGYYGSRDSIYIEAKDLDNKPFNGYVLLNTFQIWPDEENGSASIKKVEEIREIICSYNGITTKYKVKNSNSNYFKLRIYTDRGETYFKNKKVKIKEDKLQMNIGHGRNKKVLLSLK